MKPAKLSHQLTLLARLRPLDHDLRFTIHDLLRRCRFILATVFCLVVMSVAASAQVPILYYDFENNTTRTTFENLVEQAVNSGSGAITATGITGLGGVTGAGTFNGGAATGQAITAATWSSSTTDPGTAAANYYQFVVNTSGFSDLSITFDSQASSTGPARVGLLFSTDGSTFTTTTTSLVTSATFTGNSATFNLGAGANNQSSVTIRIYAFAGSAGDRATVPAHGAFSAAGTFRIDNLTVRATTVSATKTLLDYPAIGLSVKSGTVFTPTYVDFTVNAPGSTISLAAALQLSGTLSVIDGTLAVGGNTLTTNGTSTISVAGTTTVGNGGIIKNAGAFTNGGTLTFASGAKYQHNFTTTAGTIPTASWNAASTVEIIGYTTNATAPGGLNQSFGNFTWNCASESSNINLGGALQIVNGNFTLTTSSTGSLILSGTTAYTLTIGGDFIVHGGNPLDFSNGSGGGPFVVNIGGNWTQSNGATTAVVSSTNGTTRPTINFTGGVASAVFSLSSGTLTATNINWSVASGKTLSLNSNFVNAASRTFTIDVGGTVIVNGTVFSNSGTLAVNGTLQLNNPGSAPVISGTAPTYDPASLLKYNTGGSFFRSLEWSSNSNPGKPGNVQISNNTTVDIGSNDPSARSIAGNLTIDSGSTLTMAGLGPSTGALTVAGNVTNSGTLTLSTSAGGDLNVGGNFTNDGTFTPNSRLTTFNGSGAQTIKKTTGGSVTFSSLAVNKASGNLTLGAAPDQTNVTVNGTSGNVLQLLNGGIDLNDPDNALTLSGNGGNVLVSGGVRTINGPVGSQIAFTGSKTVTSASGGTLVIDQPIVVLQASVNFGSSLTTINTELRLSAAAGAVNTNPPTYGANSALNYGCACGFARGAEWSATSGPGYPAQVYLTFGATLDLGANGGQATARSLASRLYLFDGTLTMNNGGNAMTAALTVGGSVQIEAAGTLVLSSLAGGDLNAAGNFTDNGSFTHNSRVTTLNGGGTQTISGTAGSIQFGDLVAAGPDVQVSSNITVNGNLGLTGGNITTNSSTITMPVGATSSGTFDVVGDVKRTGFITGGAALSFGNPFTSIKVDSGTAPTDVLVSLVLNAPDGDGFGFSNAVTRTYTITPSGGSGYSTTLRLHYLDSELGGNDENSASFDLWHYNGSDGWTRQTKTGNDASNNWVEKTGVTQFSPWVIAGGGTSPSPTAVKLTKFNAASFSDGVQLIWESGFEVNNLGYRLYREQNGRRSRVTPSIVAGSALKVGQGNRLTAGSSYAWFDPKGTPDTTYYLEAIDLDGSRQTTGPIYPYAGFQNIASLKQQRALLLNEVAKTNSVTGDGWPAAMSPAGLSVSKIAATNSSSSNIAGNKAVKIQVRQSGWYRVTQAELVAAGFDPSSDARLLQLYVDGEEVPVRLSGEGARLNANDTLEFYGVALDTPTTDTRIYWLINGTTNGKRISSKRSKIKPGDQNWTESAGLNSFAFTTERRDKLIYSPRLLNGDAGNIFGALIFSDPTDQTLAVRNFDANSATQPQLEVALQGLTAQAHDVRVSINGTSLGNVTFNASEHATAKFTVNRTLLRDGDNTVSLSSGNGDSDISFVDFVRLSYAHQYTADNDALRFSVPGGSVVRVDGFTTPNIRVVDVTDPNSPLEVATSGSPSKGAYSVKVQALGNSTRTLMAFADQLAGHPAAVVANKPSNWNAKTNGADLVVITHGDFRQQVEPLAALRRSQGLNVAVVDVEDVYDEFSYGAHTPLAIKAFLANAVGTWARKPGYVLLVGDSSWDPRNFMDQGENDFVPTKLIDTNFMESASDDWLVDFTGQGRADLAIGRLPGRTAAEISLMVSKIMTYEQERELNAPLRGAVLVADNGFENRSAQTRALLPAGIDTQSIDRASVGNDDLMRGQVVDALNAGPMIVNFYGHGSVRVWTGAGVLDSDLADTLTNSNRPSIYLMMTCLNGYAHDAYIDSLSESVLKSQNGGAVAVWASSGYTSPEPQFDMNSQFYRLLFGALPLRLGEAAREAKLATSDLDVRRTWMLFGDPTMRVR